MKYEEEAVWFLVPTKDMEQTGETGRALVHGAYSRSGSAFTIRQMYSGKMIARASGYGYDRQGTALADALTRLYGVPAIDGAVGLSSVISHAEAHGVMVYSLAQALHMLPSVDGEIIW